MTSTAQLDANRANAQLSTGPKTEAGIAASKNNAFKHGLTSKEIVLRSEDPEAFEQLRADLSDEFSPVGLAEDMLAFELAVSWWRLLRARSGEAVFLANIIDDVNPYLLTGAAAGAYAKMHRYVAAAERAWRRALKELQQTQAFRKKHGRTPNIGFVPQKPALRVTPESPAEPCTGFVSRNYPPAGGATAHAAPPSAAVEATLASVRPSAKDAVRILTE
ncbi:MAG: hypothetical protein ABI165_13395 [Bryobacteraceae bacterium]